VSDSTQDPYDGQLRGDRGAYRRYLDGMDASMQQKVALTAAHLLCLGKVADMGMGSGTGSYSLAALYPGLSVVGVDVSPEMVAIAAERYVLPNLSFIVGDIAQPVFEPGSLDGILDSSVLHHVTTFTDYDHDAAARALAVQTQALRPGGVLIVRDFLAPSTDETVWLDVPFDDANDSGTGAPSDSSTAVLLERFAREFRPLCSEPGFVLRRVEDSAAAPLASGRRRYALSRRMAVEFVLRKDYRNDWDTEVKEEYTYFGQTRFEQVFADLGLRVLASTPIRNPWIVANRYQGKFAWWTTDGAPIELPPTNYVIVGERVRAGQGVRWQHTAAAPHGFLQLEHFAHRDTGHVVDLVRRPNLTVDALPWYIHEDDVRIVARMSYPRPLLGLAGGGALDGSRPPGWVTEPLAVIAGDKPIAQTVEDALNDRTAIAPESIVRMEMGATYYPSPGGIQEEVRSVFVEVAPVFANTDLPDSSGFSTSGRVAAIEARQLLRAAQVGGLPDARLEMAVYNLLRLRGRDPGPWIGASVSAAESTGIAATDLHTLRDRAPRRMFARVAEGADFLTVQASSIAELAADGAVLHTRTLEYVVPGPLSSRTVSAALLTVREGEVLIGVDDTDLPAAQCIGGHSSILVAPAWRLPHDITSTTPARAWVAARLERQYGLRLGSVVDLGGRYHPSPGSTPEVVHPMAWQVHGLSQGSDARRPDGPALLWVPLQKLLDHPALLVDGHLRVAAFRAAHALGLLEQASRPAGI